MMLYNKEVGLLLLLFISAVSSLQCGKPITTDCVGDNDVRYDPDASDNILDQAQVWNKLNGLFVCNGTAEGVVQGNQVDFTAAYYVNLTFQGSRFYRHDLAIMRELSAAFVVDVFATSTYERDASMVELGASQGPTATDGVQKGEAFTVASTDLKYSAIDTNSAFSTSVTSDGTFRYESYVFLNQDTFRLLYETFVIVEGEIRMPDFTGAFTCTRETDPDVWVAGARAAYDTYNVPDSMRFVVPSGCLSGSCPTEEQWCQQDPECSTSPYQEPSASLTGGAIAGFTVLIVVVVVAIVSFIYWHLLRTQEQRYKVGFAQRIAANIAAETQDSGSNRISLTPEALTQEFQKIDSIQKDGRLSKEELWQFIQTGKVGTMSRSDFNALFAAMDTQGRGQVSFLEFCAFLNSCHKEYVEARTRDEQIRRVSTTIAQKLSSRHLSVASTPTREEEGTEHDTKS